MKSYSSLERVEKLAGDVSRVATLAIDCVIHATHRGGCNATVEMLQRGAELRVPQQRRGVHHRGGVVRRKVSSIVLERHEAQRFNQPGRRTVSRTICGSRPTGCLNTAVSAVPLYSAYTSISPALSARSQMNVPPRFSFRSTDRSVYRSMACAINSPRMICSVKFFEPTTI